MPVSVTRQLFESGDGEILLATLLCHSSSRGRFRQWTSVLARGGFPQLRSASTPIVGAILFP